MLIKRATWRLMWQKHSPVSFVLAFFEGLLGSPVPTALLANTLNSYSTQGLSSMTVAVRCEPPTTFGTGTKQNAHIVWDEPPPEPAQAPCTLTQTPGTACISQAWWDNSLHRYDTKTGLIDRCCESRDKNNTLQFKLYSTIKSKEVKRYNAASFFLYCGVLLY